MLTIEYIPLPMIDSVFPLIEKGLDRINGRNGKEENNEQILWALKNNPRVMLYFAYWGDLYMGFFIAKIDQYADRREFCIYKGFKIPGVGQIDDATWELVNELAQKYECGYITFYSNRKGWQRQAGKYGFQPKTVQYIREIDHAGR